MFNFGSGSNTNTSGGNSGSGSLFGNKPAATNNGFTFGGTSNQGPSQSGGFTFGQTNTGANNTNNALGGIGRSGGLFGNKSDGGGLFGNQNNQQNGGGFFSNKSPMGAGGLFGNQNNQGSGGGLFGNKPPAGGGGQFGGQNNQMGAGGGLFGSQNNQPHQSTLFGTSMQQAPQQPQQQPQRSLFGSTTTQPSFAWSQPQNSQPIFEQQQQQQQQQQQLQFQQQQQQFQQQQQGQLQFQQQHSNYPQQVQEQVVRLKDSWDPTSNKTKLRAFVYNKVKEADAILYNKPPQVNQDEWDHAMDNKPSADVIPVQLYGFEDLNKRNQLQMENVAQSRVILNQILEKSNQLQQKHELNTAARILKAQTRNVQIERRILRLGTQLAILKGKGLPLSITEEKMWSQFQSLLQRSNNPAGLGKTNELWARLAVLKERAKSISDQLDSTLVVIKENDGNVPTNAAKEKEAPKSSDENMENRIDIIAEILSNQQRGICYLNEVLEKDNSTLDKKLAKRKK